MDVRPGYKQTDVGIIPEDWGLKQLGELFQITSSTRVFQSEWKTQGVPFYRARELAVLGESGTVDNELFITQEMYDSFKRQHGVPDVGDMLVTGVGTLGKTYVVSGDHQFYFKDGNIIWFKIGESLSPEFLRQLYLTPVVVKQIGDGSAGTTVGTYTISGAKKTRIPFPPRPEQCAIATALSDADALLAGLDRLLVKKRDLKQAAMQQLLTGQTRLPGFRSEWEVKRLGEILRFQVGFPFSSVYFNEKEIGIRLVKNRDLKSDDQLFHYSGNFDPAFVVRNGDVLVGMDGDFLPCRWSKGIALLNQRVGRIVPRAGLDAVFAFYALRKLLKQIEDITSSTTVKHLSHGDVEGIQQKLPLPAEQAAIATVLSDMDAEITTLEARRDKTRAIKQGMMQELLTGKKRLV